MPLKTSMFKNIMKAQPITENLAFHILKQLTIFGFLKCFIKYLCIYEDLHI